MTDVFFLGPHHPIFETVVKHPPRGYRVTGDVSDYSGKDIKEYYDKFYLVTKSTANNLFRLFHFPRVILISHEHLFDIAFTVNALPLTSKPFIVGAETVYHLIGYTTYNPFTASTLIKMLRKAKAIVAISYASKESIINYIRLFKPEIIKEIQEKLEVVYPAIDVSYSNSILSTREESDTFWLVHVNTRPLLRGLREFLEASTVLGNEFDIGLRIKLTPRFVTEEVIQILNRYIEKLSNLGVKIYLKIGNLTRKELFKQFYLQGNLFVLPTWRDTFGYVFLEAMSAGLPCIGTDLWAIPEIIGNDKSLIHLPCKPYSTYPNLKYLTTEFLLQRYSLLRDSMSPKVVKELSEKIRQLIDDPSELKKTKSYVYRETREGKFSIRQQQNKLKDIYEGILKR